MSSSKLHDSKSILGKNESSGYISSPLIQIEAVQDLFHSEIDFVDFLQKLSPHLKYLDFQKLVKLHKTIRDELADIVHGNEVIGIVNLLKSMIPRLVVAARDTIHECQLHILQYDDTNSKKLINFVWNRLTEYPKLLVEIKNQLELSDADIEDIENCCKQFRFMIIDLHVLCQ